MYEELLGNVLKAQAQKMIQILVKTQSWLSGRLFDKVESNPHLKKRNQP